jgi:osmoprotectant transport system ATP-binding protein
MIALRSVSKMFGGHAALRALSIEFARGQTHLILGSSGCGKSTLIRLVAGILQPDEGEIEIDGTRMTESAQPRLAERIGYVIQEGGLFPHLTAWRNVALKATLLGWPQNKIERRVAELAAMTGITEAMLARYPGELSGGQRQRVSLMRALMLDPPVLLLDEPLGALDPIVRSELQTQLRELFLRLRKTVLLVTHDVGEAEYLGQTVTLLNDGRIEQHGTFQDLLYKPATPFITRFINAQRPPDEGRRIFSA